MFVDTPGFQTKHSTALNKSLNKTVMGAIGDVDLILFVVEAGNFGLGDAKVLSLLPTTTPVVLLANKLDQIKRRAELMTWLADMQTRHPFAEIVPLSAKKPADMERLLDIAQHYLPKQAWVYQDGELSDRNESFLVKEIIREKLFRLSGDELPYTSTVVVDQFIEEPLQTPQPGQWRTDRQGAARYRRRQHRQAPRRFPGHQLQREQAG